MISEQTIEKLSLNYPPLDREHMAFWHEIKRVDKACADKDLDGIRHGFESCYNYARTHFVHEESIMDKIHFPDKEAHLKSHATFIKNISEMRGLFETAPTDEKKLVIGKQLSEFLNVWFIGHLMSRDHILKPYLVRIRALLPENP